MNSSPHHHQNNEINSFKHQRRAPERRSFLLLKSKLLWVILILSYKIALAFIIPLSPLRNQPFIGKSQFTTTTPTTTTQIFGIKGFRGWFESKFPNAILKVPRHANETFDHVLIDVNQILHVAVRRSKNEDHAIALLMRELNSCVEFTQPRVSLVLAMDGAPPAAKLATSRKRRLTTLVRNEWKQAQLERLRESKRLSLSPRQTKKLSKKYASEIETLRITPGTKFMERANNVLLYWAWQRMLYHDGPLSKVAIYVSSSIVPGEGEIKLLDWILRKRPEEGSVAVISGDSDLVLEGLLIPPSICTHNIFVLLPELGKEYNVVSLWETTRHIAQFLPELKAEDIMYVRTDMVLLLIQNGNDYLPRLRGSGGFNRVFDAYLKVVRKWLKEGQKPPFLIEPQSLVFRREFAIEFFSELKLDVDLSSAVEIAEQQCTTRTPIGQLNNLVSSAFMPKPMRWKLLSNSGVSKNIENIIDEIVEKEWDDQAESDEEDDDDDEEDYEEEEDFKDFEEVDPLFEIDGSNDLILRLSLGKKGSNDYYCYETKHSRTSTLKETKNKLSLLALEDLMGPDYSNDARDDSATSTAYGWEIAVPVEADCELYLKGLLWNLQTYQDGICSDYGYNYGKRIAPTAASLVDFFQLALDEDRQVDKDQLLGSNFTSPMSNGVSGLASLPSQLHELIAEPYSKISSDRVETFYEQSVNSFDNTFNIKKFQELCEAEIAPFDIDNKGGGIIRASKEHKRVELGEDFWTVIFRSHKPSDIPFEPPPPVVENFSSFHANRRIKSTRFYASTRPRKRSAWMEKLQKKKSNLPSFEIDLCGIDELISSSKGTERSISGVDYWRPFDKWQKEKEGERRKRIRTSEGGGKKGERRKRIRTSEGEGKEEGKRKRRRTSESEIAARIKEFKMEIDSSIHPEKGCDGHSPIFYLEELVISKLIVIEWSSITPSPTDFASVNPSDFACIQLSVSKGDNGENFSFNDEIVFQRDCEIYNGSKKRARMFLASSALTKIFDQKKKKWYEMTVKEMRNALSRPQKEKQPSARRNNVELQQPLLSTKESITGQTAMQYLMQIEQEKMINATFSVVRHTVGLERVDSIRLVVCTGKEKLANSFKGELIYERDQPIDRGLKLPKQDLAAMTLNQLIGEERQPWMQYSFKDLRVLLKDGTLIETGSKKGA